MATSHKSVVYRMSPQEELLNSKSLISAQKLALAHDLPLAVVYCWRPDSGRIADMIPLERELSAYGIPLIALIGEPEKVMAGFCSHVDPLQIFDGYSEETGGEVIAHPYKWPGVVINIEKLQNMIDNNEHIC